MFCVVLLGKLESEGRHVWLFEWYNHFCQPYMLLVLYQEIENFILYNLANYVIIILVA